MPILPARFLFRVAYPCGYVKNLPARHGGLVDLPEARRLDNFAAMEEVKRFADVRLGWNELGLGLSVEVHGKSQSPAADQSRFRASDGVTFWIDTRDARTSHRASRYCHQFHFLPTGGGPEHHEPVLGQTKINRALQDAPVAPAGSIPFQASMIRGGYRIEAFLTAAALHGFDSEQNRRLGVFYVVRDAELGEQTLSVGADFPYWEDPSLWSVLELMK
jgi:hypothetical protein